MFFFPCLVKWESTDPVSAGGKRCLRSAAGAEVLVARGEARSASPFPRQTARDVPGKPGGLQLPLCLGKRRVDLCAPQPLGSRMLSALMGTRVDFCAGRSCALLPVAIANTWLGFQKGQRNFLIINIANSFFNSGKRSSGGLCALGHGPISMGGRQAFAFSHPSMVFHGALCVF